MEYREIRKKYIEYLKSRGHAEIVNASLVPENDPSILFTPAGMSPIVPYLMGETHPQGTRLTNIQRCIRTGDIDEVGDAVHLTFFEMTGNWSLNDYFKDEAIDITFSFLVEELGFKPESLYGSVFQGDEDAPKDEESIEALKKTFARFEIDAKEGERIQLYGKDKNWWELPAGGPCGPDSEIFVDTGKETCGPDCHINCDCGKYVEMGNNVFMQYLKKGPGQYEPLGKHNVDFGGGLARWAMILQGVDNVYDTDIYRPIKTKVENLATKEFSPDKGRRLEESEGLKSIRLITEHINTAVMILMDGVVPSNVEQGYILRRIIRRAIRHARQLGIPTPFAKEVAKVVVQQWKEFYPQLVDKQEFILEELEKEENKFARTVEQGEKVIRKEDLATVDGNKVFYFYETYGYPFELSLEILKEAGNVDEVKLQKEFDIAFEEHQKKSRAGAGDKFKGGLADTSEMSTRYHTATHLLNAALKEIVGDHVYQKGSNITPERLRFDFPNPSKLTQEEVAAVESWVNDKIERKLPITWEEMTPEKAKELGAEGVFSHRYGDVIKVYTVGDKENPVSMEICGGPHVENTGDLGKFKIKKQENVGAGIKRIKAVLE